MGLERSRVKRFLNLNELEELRNDSYRNSKISKDRSKKRHDQILLYDSKLHIFPGKLKSRWIGPFTIHQVYPNRSVELLNSNESQTFKVNGHRLKLYAVPFGPDKEEFTLLEPLPAVSASPSAAHPSAPAQL